MILSLRFQCDAAGVGGESCHLSTGSPSLCSGITRGYAWCASSGGGSVWMREQRWESESGEYPQDHTRYTETVVGDAVSESIRKAIYDIRGWS